MREAGRSLLVVRSRRVLFSRASTLEKRTAILSAQHEANSFVSAQQVTSHSCRFPRDSRTAQPLYALHHRSKIVPLPGALARRFSWFPLTGWTANTTPSGRTFYENHLTKSTTWERPTAPAAKEVPLQRNVSFGPTPASSAAGGGSVSTGGQAPLPPGTLVSCCW